MVFIGSYIKNFLIHATIAFIIAAIAGSISPFLGGLTVFVGMFAVFITSYKWTIKDVKKLGQETSRPKAEDSNFINITVTSSFDHYDMNFDNETFEVIDPSTIVNICGFEIDDALIYVNKSGAKSNLPHVVPQKLKVSQNGSRGEIGYWPSYSEIGPGHRYDYLKWLSAGKDDPDIDTGLLFLYFYGLEWRVIKEEKDFEWVAKEVLKLMSLYDNNSFQNYSRNLLTCIVFKGLNNLSKETLVKIKDHAMSARPYSSMGESGLSMFIDGTKEVTADLLFLQIPNFEKVSRSKVPGKVGHLFYDHLRFLLRNKIEDICAKATISDRTFHVRTASGCIRGKDLKGKEVKIPKKDQNVLAKAWNQAIEDLRKYSGRMDKDSKEKLYTLLPDNLKEKLDHPLEEHLDDLLGNESDKIMKFGSVAEMCGYTFKEKYTLKECCMISDILSDTQVALEPEPNYFRKSFKYDDKVCVYRSGNSKLKGPTYSTISMLLDLGVSLAYTDDKYDEKEIATVQTFIEERFCKDKPELAIRSSKRLMLYRNSPPKTNGLIKKLSERLKIKELNLIGNYLFEVAIADGDFAVSEQKYLKKVFKGLGIEELYESSLDKYLSHAGNLSLKKSSKDTLPAEEIPQPYHDTGFSIDEDRLKALELDTKEVQDALSQVFIAEDFDSPIVEEKGPGPAESVVSTLTDNEDAFLREVLKFSTLKRDQMRSIAKKYGFMPGPIIEKINVWSEDLYGDYLIFDEGDYIVEQDLVEEHAQSA